MYKLCKESIHITGNSQNNLKTFPYKAYILFGEFLINSQNNLKILLGESNT